MRGFQDGLFQFAVKIVAGNIIQDGAPVGIGNAESRSQTIGGSFGMGNADDGFGDGLKDGHLIAFLETVPADGRCSRRRRDDHHRRMAHIGRRHGSDHIGNAGAVLAGDDAAAARHAAISVFHMSGALFMTDGDEFDSRRRKEIEHVHKSGAYDTANMIHTFRQQGFDNRLTGRHFYFFHFLNLQCIQF